MFKKILVPTDGSAFSDREIKKASELIDDDGEIVVLSVAKQLNRAFLSSQSKIDELNSILLDEAEFAVKKMKDKFDSNLNVTTKVVVGFPAESINEVAEEEDVDLIVISASGKSGIHKFFIGSVAEKVLSSADKDVLLVHH